MQPTVQLGSPCLVLQEPETLLVFHVWEKTLHVHLFKCLRVCLCLVYLYLCLGLRLCLGLCLRVCLHVWLWIRVALE